MGMKSKTIRKILAGKMNQWIYSIEDTELQKAVFRDTIVTGGCIASMLLGEPINDFDVYFKTKETAKRVSEYYMSKFNFGPYRAEVREDKRKNIKGVEEDRISIYIKSKGVAGEVNPDADKDVEKYLPHMAEKKDGVGEEEKPKYRPIFFSENAITLSDKVQIVVRFFGSPEEIHGNYDFVHAMNYYVLNEDKLVLKPEALEALLSRTLIYRGSLYPVCSMFRCKKFIERGWKISASEMLKIGWQISEVDLSDIQTLREQLTGVDAAYFHMLISALSDYDGEITGEYVAKIIDRMNGDQDE